MNTKPIEVIYVSDEDLCPFNRTIQGCSLKDYSFYDDYITEDHRDCPLREKVIMVVKGT